MSYRLNKTDGSLVVELTDGRLDTTTLNINLIGKNYQGFGESINENFIKLLENFSNSSAPSKPIKGQLWYDSATGRLKVYDGVTFRSTDSTVFSSTRPAELIQGDIWINGSTNQMYFFDGTSDVLVGPAYTKNQSKSGDFIETIKDTTGQNKVVTKKYLNGSLLGIYSKEAFTPFPAITGFTNLVQGFTVNSAWTNYEFTGKAASARQLIDGSGNTFDTDSFVSSGPSGDVMQGRLVIDTSIDPLIIGNNRDITLDIDGTIGIIRSSKSNNDFKIELQENVTDPAGNTFTALYFDTWNASRIGNIGHGVPDTIVAGPALGIFTDTPEYALDVNGSVRIKQDLIVEGDSISLDIQSLRVQDKQIELAIFEDSSLPTDAAVDDAGIVVRVAGDDKRWTWRQASDSWTSSHSIEMLPFNAVLKIDGNDVLSKTTLGSSVINSSLTTVGQLESLVVGASSQSETMTITYDTLESSTGLVLKSLTDITVFGTATRKITGVATPVSARAVAINPLLTEGDDSDVATKKYVDDEIAAVSVVTGIDVTGLGTNYATGTYDDGTCDDTLLDNVVILIEEIKPATDLPNNTIARIHATNTTATTDAIDLTIRNSTAPDAGETFIQTLTPVDSAGVQNVEVVRSIDVANDPTATVNLTINRYVITIRTSAGQWVPDGGTIAASAV